MEKAKITPETEVSTTELACVLGITGRRIRQLAEDGQLEKLNRGRFNLCDSVQRYLASVSAGPLDKEDLSVEKIRRKSEATLKAAKARMSKMEVDEMEGHLHRSEDVAAMTEDLIYSIRAMLMSLPGRMSTDVFAAESPAEASDIIRREVYKIMEELSHYRYDPAAYEERVRERKNWGGKAVDADDE